MNTPHCTLTRGGRALQPKDEIILKNGTKMPAGVIQALNQAYVAMMMKKGVLTASGKVNRSALLVTDSIAKVRAAASAALRNVPNGNGTRPPANLIVEAHPMPAASRPRVPNSPIKSFDGRYEALFGDRNFIEVDIDARASAAGSSAGGALGSELSLAVTLPGLGRVDILRQDVDVGILQDLCWTRAELDPAGQEDRIVATTNVLPAVQPWRARQRLGRTQVMAYGIPVDLEVDLTGTAGVTCLATAKSSYSDPKTSQAIMSSVLAPQSANVDGSRMQGLYSTLRLEGSASVGLNLRKAVDFLSEYDGGLSDFVLSIADSVPGLDLFTRQVGEVGASIDVALAELQLRTEGFYRLDFTATEQRGGKTVLVDNYVQSGAADATLEAKFLANPEIKVFFKLSLPDGINVVWDVPPWEITWATLGDSFPVWGWDGALFEAEVPVLRARWSESLGPGPHRIIAQPPVLHLG